MTDFVTNYTNAKRNGGTHKIELEPIGDEKTEIRNAAQRAFNGRTSDVRATQIAAGVSEANPAHAHSQAYKRRAEQLTVKRETVERNGLEYVTVYISDDK